MKYCYKNNRHKKQLDVIHHIKLKIDHYSPWKKEKKKCYWTEQKLASAKSMTVTMLDEILRSVFSIRQGICEIACKQQIKYSTVWLGSISYYSSSAARSSVHYRSFPMQTQYLQGKHSDEHWVINKGTDSNC